MALFCDGANGAAVVAAVGEVEPTEAVAVEVEEVRAVAAALVQRARPVDAERATAVDHRAGAAARSGEKDRITVGASDLLAADTVDRSPFPRTLIAEFLNFIPGGHTPTTAPLHVGYIVGGTADVGTDIYPIG